MLLANGANINYAGNSTPLIWASCQRNTKLAEKLLANGADANQYDNHGNYPLIHAVKYGLIDLIKLLLANGALVNKVDNEQQSALTWSIHYKDVNLVEILLSSGANVNHATRPSLLPLHLAIRRGSEQIVELLLANGAIVTQKYEPENNTPLQYAQIHGEKNIEMILRNHLYTILVDTGLNVLPRDILREIINYL